MQSLVRLAPIPLLTGVALAQVPPYTNPPIAIDGTAACAGLASATAAGATDVGDLTGNLDPEVIVQLDDGVLVFVDPVVSSMAFTIDEVCNDLVVWTAPDGTQRLILATAGGIDIYALTFDYTIPEVDWTVTSITQSAAQGLKSLRVVDLDGSGALDLLGIGSNGQSFVALLADTNSSSGFSLVAGSPATYGQAFDLLAADTDGDNSQEIIAVTTAGLEFYNLAGTMLQGYVYSASRGEIALMGPDSSPTVAWVRPTASDPELVIATVSAAGTPVALTGHNVVGLDSGDLDGDGDRDLALSLSDSSQMLALEDLGGSVDLTYARTLSNGESSNSGNLSEPLLADIDGDEHIDAVWFDHVTRSIEVAYSSDWTGYSDYVPQVGYLDFTNYPEIRWEFDDFGAYENQQSSTWLQLRVFNQFADPSTGWSPPDAAESVPHTDAVVLLQHLTGTPYQGISFDLKPTSEQRTAYLAFVEARFVTEDANGNQILHPPQLVALCPNGENGAETYFRSHYVQYYVYIDDIGNGGAVGVGEPPPPPADPPTKPGGGG